MGLHFPRHDALSVCRVCRRLHNDILFGGVPQERSFRSSRRAGRLVERKALERVHINGFSPNDGLPLFGYLIGIRVHVTSETTLHEAMSSTIVFCFMPVSIKDFGQLVSRSIIEPQ